jgi:hypothetical protein
LFIIDCSSSIVHHRLFIIDCSSSIVHHRLFIIDCSSLAPRLQSANDGQAARVKDLEGAVRLGSYPIVTLEEHVPNIIGNLV